MSSTVRTSPSVTSPLRPTRDDPNLIQTTPTSIKRPRLMASQGKQRKNVRFADTCDEIPAPTEFTMSNGSMSSEDLFRQRQEEFRDVVNARTDTENRPTSIGEQDKLSGRPNQPANFIRTSPRKAVQVAASPAQLPGGVTLATGDTSLSNSPQVPSPLTPRRSAMKRKAQEPLDAYEHSAQVAFRSPMRRPGSANSSSNGIRLILSDTNIEASQEECIYPNLRRCTDGVTSLCLMMAETSRTSLLARTLRENGITTIGKFASLTPSMLEQIPYLKRPKLDNAVAYLKAHIPNNMERESPLSSQERRDRENATRSDQNSQERMEVESQDRTVQEVKQESQPVQVQINNVQEIKIEEPTPDAMISPMSDQGMPNLDENADAQPMRSPRKDRSAPTTPVKTPQKMVIPQLSPSTQTGISNSNQVQAGTSKSNQVQATASEVQQTPRDQITSGSQNDFVFPTLHKTSQLTENASTTSNLVSAFAQTSPGPSQVLPIKTSMEQQTTPQNKPTISNVEQQTSPVKMVEKTTIEQQTTPKKSPVHFDLEDSSASVSDVTGSQVGNVLKKKVADLTRLVNNAFPPSSSRPNLTVLESVRSLQADFQNQEISRGECSELVSLLLDFAKMANDKAGTLEK